MSRIKNFQQVVVLKCLSCNKWQGQATSRTQEQLNDSGEQRKFKMKFATCNYCQKKGRLIDLFYVKGICSNREAMNIVSENNLQEALRDNKLQTDFK